MASLKFWNGVLTIIHCIVAIILIVYFLSVNKRNKDESTSSDVENIDTALYDHKINIDLENPEKTEIVSEKVTGSNSNWVQIFIVTFIVITAIAHFIYFLNPKGIYSKGVDSSNNKWRWLEYSISATIMIAAILILSGVKNLDTVMLAIVGTIIVMLQGDLVEKSLNRGDKFGWFTPTFVGWITLIVIFVIIIKAFRKRLDEAREAGFELPKWLNFVVYPMLIWFASFGIVQLVQIFKGGNYVKYEKAYLSLSLLSKAFLAIFVAYGFGQRQSNQE